MSGKQQVPSAQRSALQGREPSSVFALEGRARGTGRSVQRGEEEERNKRRVQRRDKLKKNKEESIEEEEEEKEERKRKKKKKKNERTAWRTATRGT